MLEQPNHQITVIICMVIYRLLPFTPIYTSLLIIFFIQNNRLYFGYSSENGTFRAQYSPFSFFKIMIIPGNNFQWRIMF